jgi:DnaJ-class molecular chaperone
MSKDYYKTLGVSKTASEADIKSAFRKLAHEHHPDKNKGDDKKFKEINEAYQTLSDKNKRAQYDQFGSSGPQFGGGGNPFGQGGQGGFGGFSWEDIMRQAQQQGGFQQGGFGGDNVEFDLGDIFGMFTGQGFARRGRNVQADVTLTFKESIKGVKKEIEIPTYKDGKQTGSKKITIEIPAGVDHGEQLRMDGYGEEITGGKVGNLIVVIRVQKHPVFHKEGPHIVMSLDVSLTDALLGATIEIETLDGKEKLEIPHGLESGTLLHIKGAGVSAGAFRKGDLVIKTRVVMPKKLSKKAKELIEDLRKELE